MRRPVSEDLTGWIRSHVGLCFLVVSAAWVLFLYWRGLFNPFSSYDDQTVIVNNPGLGSEPLLRTVPGDGPATVAGKV